jgi:hypothetical protein
VKLEVTLDNLDAARARELDRNVACYAGDRRAYGRREESPFANEEDVAVHRLGDVAVDVEEQRDRTRDSPVGLNLGER